MSSPRKWSTSGLAGPGRRQCDRELWNGCKTKENKESKDSKKSKKSKKNKKNKKNDNAKNDKNDNKKSSKNKTDGMNRTAIISCHEQNSHHFMA